MYAGYGRAVAGRLNNNRQDFLLSTFRSDRACLFFLSFGASPEVAKHIILPPAWVCDINGKREWHELVEAHTGTVGVRRTERGCRVNGLPHAFAAPLQ